jgi:hypothetical protein
MKTSMFRMGFERQAFTGEPGGIYYGWGDLFGDVIKYGSQAGVDIYRKQKDEEIADDKAEAAAATAAAAQAEARAAAARAAGQNPTILGLPQGVVILGGVGLALAVGLYAVLR